MPSFLFWNLARKPLIKLVTTLAHSHEIDLLILAECDISPVDLLLSLNEGRADFQYAPGLCTSLRFFTRFDADFLQPQFESARVSIRSLALPAKIEVLIAAAHLPSKLFYSDESIRVECSDLARRIEEQEDKLGHRRTILIGDLNLNPFEPGIISAGGGLNSVLSRDIALRKTRIIQSKEYRYFYNPMWRHFADGFDRPQGTFFYDRADHFNYYWNIFDQVLLRPDLIQQFTPEQVEIVTSAGTVSLLDGKGRPDKSTGSDHLPVLFSLDF